MQESGCNWTKSRSHFVSSLAWINPVCRTKPEGEMLLTSFANFHICWSQKVSNALLCVSRARIDSQLFLHALDKEENDGWNPQRAELICQDCSKPEQELSMRIFFFCLDWATEECHCEFRSLILQASIVRLGLPGPSWREISVQLDLPSAWGKKGLTKCMPAQ